MPDAETATAQIDAHIEALAPAFREAMQHLRAVIRAAAPEAEEIITYAMPGIGLEGPLVSYCAFKTHCSLFPMGNSVFTGMEDEIAPWRTSKGTLQFTPDAPLPDALVIRIVKARIAENIARTAQRKARRRSPKA
ncbi:iron chaperone [Devosia chinhatensis]|uniref:YdhG-like domain-containing protein n=1 Tax=Devosia chinhatensis TaxID=429727 RepID=A0A0F5FHC2_9HYPH|nr:DUF1801 domain-containing protein [Devosia chinhatensis]KKB08294.1 hypothetical protein VE26_13600 [Devosia chinhatensis]